MIWALVAWPVLIGLGFAIARGRGALCAALLGPIGVVVALFLPEPEPKQKRSTKTRRRYARKRKVGVKPIRVK